MYTSLECQQTGQTCQNLDVINGYVVEVNEAEADARSVDPSSHISSGSIACSGCEFAPGQGAISCSAILLPSYYGKGNHHENFTGPTATHIEEVPGFERSWPTHVDSIDNSANFAGYPLGNVEPQTNSTRRQRLLARAYALYAELTT